MALRVPWDEQETALLLDAYLRVKNKELSKQRAIKEVSSLLRRRATLSGMEIDDVFRNENEITIHITIIGGLVENRPSSLRPASKLFKDMVALYRNNPTGFYEILTRAKEECTMQTNVEDEFFTWLQERVSPAQLSDFYRMCQKIESFCTDNHILAQPLFETTNTFVIQDVINTIKSNRKFQYRYYQQLGRMRKVMDYYMSFLQKTASLRSTESEYVSVAQHTAVPSNVQAETQYTNSSTPQPVVAAVREEATVSVSEKEDPCKEDPAETIQVAVTDKSSGDTPVWNFAHDRIDFSHAIPTAISYFGETAVVQDWADVFAKTVRILQEDYPAIIRGMVGYRFGDIEKVILTGITGKDSFRQPIELDHGLYMETDCTPDEIVSIIRTLMDKCNMDYDNIELSYRETGAADAVAENRQEASAISTSAAETRTSFENWLTTSSGLTQHTAQKCVSAIQVANRYAMQLGFSEKDLFLIPDAEQVYQISRELLSNPEFAQLNMKQHNYHRAALSKYWYYCKAHAAKVAANAPKQNAPEQNAPEQNAPEQKDEIKENRAAFIAWVQSRQMQKAAILACLLDINKCSEFARKNGYLKEKHLFLVQDASALERIFLEMQKDRGFTALNSQRQKRPAFAMKQLIAFRRATVKSSAAPFKAPESSAEAAVISPVDPQVKQRYTAVLAENFADGFRPTKAIDRNRFRMYYGDMFGAELTEDDDRLIHTLTQVGTLRDERIFVKDESGQKDLIEEINDTIMGAFQNGASCIYLDCLFARFQEQLAEMLHIYNVDSLESMLFSSGKRNYFKRYRYLFDNHKEPAPARDVIEYMKKSHLPVTYSEIEKALWYMPLEKMKHTLSTTPGIINVSSEAYLYAPNLPVSEGELAQIADLIGNALLQRNYISDVELMQLLEEHCPSIIMNTPDYPTWGLRNALAYLLRDRFSFRGAIISEKGEEISMAEVFSDLCQRSEHLTIDELKQFAGDLNTSVYWDSVYNEMIRVNQNEFVRRDQIHFDIEQTDHVLDALIQAAYTPLKVISLFLHFPAIEVPWNSFVLESYVANYSKTFRLLHTGYTSIDCYGAIVRQDSGISDYRTLIVDVLSGNVGWNSQKDALQLLVELGYQQKRSYGDIENVMQEAKAQAQSLKS